jgi:predicted DCC family thiol-disulfide oxidoreductase YuxK
MKDTYILYNGRCPICRAEITQYAHTANALDAPLVFEDLHAANLSQWHLTPEQAMRRLHARAPDGSVTSGIEAFALIWDHLPKLRWLARGVRAPILGPVAALIYDRIAAPLLYYLHQRRERLGKVPPAP